MIFLPNRVIKAPEEQQNFDYLSTVISQNRFGDAVIGSIVKGVTAKKLAVEDTQGKVIGYVPVYPE